MRVKCICMVLLASFVLTMSFPALGAPKVEISIAHPWTTETHTHWGLENAAKGFTKKHPDISVKILTGFNNDKCLVQIAAGVPPDIFSLDGPMVSSWALKGLLQPLDPFIKKSGVNPKDFVPPAWRQCEWDGKVWAMSYIVDPNFALLWNEDLFDEAGLDPKVGPKTLTDLERFFPKLTRYDSAGKIKQVAMAPWEVYGNANTMYTWGWIFGGTFYDYEKQKATAHDQRNVDALTYIRDWYLRYSTTIAPLNQGLPTGANRFTGGRQAMTFCVTGDLRNYQKFFPDLRIGIGPMFYKPESGVANPAWVGGHTLIMPVGVKHPDAAWEFLRYLTADPEGTSLFAEASGWFPSYLPAPVFQEKFARDRYMSVYMRILLSARNQRPVIPVQQTYWDELEKALPQVFAGKIQPREALQYVSERVDTELAKALKEADAKSGQK